MNMLDIDVAQIAKVVHEANRAYCLTIGDTSVKAWEDCTQAHRDSYLQGVLLRINQPLAGPEVAHAQWMEAKFKDGWKLGPKSVENKTHPSLVPYVYLPANIKFKDQLFTSIVQAFLSKREQTGRGLQATSTMLVPKKTDESVELGLGPTTSVSSEYDTVMRVLGFTQVENAYVYNYNGRAIWVNPTRINPTQDITRQIAATGEAIGQRAKINEIRKALDLPFDSIPSIGSTEVA